MASSDAIRALLVDLLGKDPSTHGLADHIHTRTGGNPFFIEEVVSSFHAGWSSSPFSRRAWASQTVPPQRRR